MQQWGLKHYAGMAIFILFGVFATEVMKMHISALSCLFIRLHETTQKPLNKFSGNFMIGSFSTIS
jgi:hypothetical protein